MQQGYLGYMGHERTGRPRKTDKLVRVVGMVTKQELANVERAAQRDGRSVAGWIRAAIRAVLERGK